MLGITILGLLHLRADDGDFARDRQQQAVNIQLISDLCDLTVPSTMLGYANFDDGIIGLAGTTSSLLGVYGAWQKTA
jgi:peroxin-11B